MVHTSIVIGYTNEDELKTSYFLERREPNIINIGGKGTKEVSF